MNSNINRSPYLCFVDVYCKIHLSDMLADLRLDGYNIMTNGSAKLNTFYRRTILLTSSPRRLDLCQIKIMRILTMSGDIQRTPEKIVVQGFLCYHAWEMILFTFMRIIFLRRPCRMPCKRNMESCQKLDSVP